MHYDLDKLSIAVARHETASCTTGIGPKYNNCHGIKNGNTAPCKRIGYNNFCIYDDPSESHDAFKKIWDRWYGDLPNLAMAGRWSGGDGANWRSKVMYFYNL